MWLMNFWLLPLCVRVRRAFEDYTERSRCSAPSDLQMPVFHADNFPASHGAGSQPWIKILKLRAWRRLLFSFNYYLCKAGGEYQNIPERRPMSTQLATRTQICTDSYYLPDCRRLLSEKPGKNMPDIVPFFLIKWLWYNTRTLSSVQHKLVAQQENVTW